MKRLKVLALSSSETESYYRRLATALNTIDIDLVCLTELSEAINSLKEARFNVVLLDSDIVNLDDACFKISWICRTPLVVITSDPPGDLSELQNIDVNNMIPRTSGDSKIIALILDMGKKGRIHLPRIKIVAIEDERFIRDAIQICFHIYWPEAEVFLAAAGQEGIDMINQKQPDLILLDLGLPDISGFDVLNHLQVYNWSPVIVLTALSDKERVVQAIRSGAKDYIVKPFRHIDLMQRIKKVVDQFPAVTR